MKKKILEQLDILIRYLESVRFKYREKEDEKLGYSSLSPIGNGDENGHYSKALLWSLENRKKEDIKNIALTGPYGSGKSSILKTFQKNYKGKDLKFLNISLATFKEEDSELGKKEDQVHKSELLRLIETSILEQIFYHEEDNKIPDSRFKKIKSYNLKKLLLLSLGYLLFLISLYNYFNPYLIQDVFQDTVINSKICSIVHYSGIIIILLGFFFIILKSVRIISVITLNKFKVQNAEIGIGENLNKSVLNHHIDEILYFFSVRPYNVVIIEDLDRFRETEIFTKLREINLLLNNSEKTKRKEIVFVYAVRDDMFKDKERTKFFDFIIPVIPVINSSNSSEILLKKKKEYTYNLSDSLIENLSFFIDDMRLLHNISNEFYLYTEKLNKSLNQDKLFAIITYKNIYPNDFMKLSYNDGILYNVLKLKNTFVKKEVAEIDRKIKLFKDRVVVLEGLFINNLEELRLLYVLRIIETLPGFKSFNINDKDMSIDDVIDDANFEYLTTDNYSYTEKTYSYYGNMTTPKSSYTTKFIDIEKRVDSKPYLLREKEIADLTEGKIVSLRKQIAEYEEEKKGKRKAKLAELLKTGSIDSSIDLPDNYDKSFINILLRNGYIAEDYLDYVSLFHEESITRADFQFHISIKSEINQPFDYKLAKLDKLLFKINPVDFQTEYILNYDILDYVLLHSKQYQVQLDSIFNKLKDESTISIEFIEGYFGMTPYLKDFIKKLCNAWSNIWGFVETNVDFSEDFKNELFISIIEFGDIKDIEDISKQSSFKNNILSNSLFLNVIKDTNKLKMVIEKLNVIFKDIDFTESSEEMLSFIYERNYYELNVEMISSIIKQFGEFNQVDFDNSNYYLIMSSNANKLIQYLDKNIDDYVRNIYLKIDSNKKEKESSYIELLNNENIELKNMKRIILQVETKITKLASIKDSTLYPMLLENNKIIPSWENLLYNYNSQIIVEDDEFEIFKSCILFINVLENAQELSKVKVPKEENKDKNYNVFYKKLIQRDEIGDLSYDLITKSSPWWYSNLKIENLSENKIVSLINNTCISPVIESYNSLKEHTNGLNIYLLEKRKTEYFKILQELSFDSDDLKLVLKSTVLTNFEKSSILKKCTDETIITDDNLKLLANIAAIDRSFIVTDNILNEIFKSNNVLLEDKISLFSKNANKYDLSFTESFLESLGGIYKQITDKRQKAKLPKNESNEKFLEVLEKKGYISSFSTRSLDYMVNHKRK
ncbi:DNA-binding protein [Myroides odoratimimus]|uniref:YobI family P-loop NTPase n=1 Tax=Myroides odoratimimus TaxID=76832 RepID=UPI0007288DB4|nr:hypothetical protein [Myroides odoratimimus]GAQ16035.1 DNA-binding protein [Myroides odoratimimus]STZ49414.1 Uncharacterised protein [Myroides odoratimimus]